MSSLLKEFNVDLNDDKVDITKLNLFQDKNKLDEVRKKIITTLLDSNIALTSDYVVSVINNQVANYNLTKAEKNDLYNLIDNEMNGFGPLTEVLKDANITAIMVNSPTDVYLEADGEIIKDESITFINNDHILRTIKKLVEPIGYIIKDTTTSIETKLLDGSKINCLLPPISEGPILTIKKQNIAISTMEDLIRVGTLTTYMAEFLAAAITAKLKILVVGDESSGKTNLIASLINVLPENCRIVALETESEIKVTNHHLIRLDTENKATQNNLITINRIFDNARKFMPENFAIGEIDQTNCFEVLNLMNSTNSGVITSIYASNALDAFTKISCFSLISQPNLTENIINQYLRGLDLIIKIEKLPDNKHKITSISEITGTQELKIKEIFAYKKNSNQETSGEFIMYKFIPETYQKIKKQGINSLDNIFKN